MTGMKKTTILITYLAVLTVALIAVGSVASGSPGVGEVVTVPSGKVIHRDFFALAEVVEISGTVNGDVYAAGKLVRVSGRINGDLLAAAETLSISGTVAQDARVAARQVTVTGRIGKNITVGGRNVEITDSAAVGGGVLAGAVDVVLSAPVGKDVKVAATNLTVSGRIGGDVDAAAKFTILTSGAYIGGDLTYWSEREALLEEGASVNGTVKRIMPSRAPAGAPVEEKPRYLSGSRLLMKALSFVTVLVVGLLLLRFFPNFNHAVVTKLRERPWASIGIGFIALIMIPVIGIMLIFTIIGIPFALFLMVSYPLSIYLVRIFAVYWLGTVMFARRGGKTGEGWVFSLGLLVFFAATLVPYAGGLVNLAAVLFGLGAAIMTKRELYYKARESNII
jgi:cytoskeletal protein CcmA (bactofilin family)